MKEKEQDYAKKVFNEIANKYDEIEFFKTSAGYVCEIIQKHTSKRPLDILDVACGTGNVVLECAAQLPDCNFDAMDISEGMLNKAKENAKSRNLSNIQFHLQDVTKLELDKKYHIITCSYAMFFLPNPSQVVKNLVAQLRPKGILVFTTFTALAFKPSTDILLPLLIKHGSPSAKDYDPDAWTNLTKKTDITRLCTVALVGDMNSHTEDIRYGLSIDQWWELCNNTGFSGMLMELGTEDYEQVKHAYMEQMLSHADMDGEVELVADTHFVVVDR